MSLRIPDPPSQGAGAIQFTPHFLENDDIGLLQTAMEALIALVLGHEDAKPQGFKFLADVQFSSAQRANNVVNYSVMIIIGEYNP